MYFIRSMLNLNKHSSFCMFFSFQFIPSPPWDVDVMCLVGSLRMGPTLIQHFGMSQLQFGTLTTAFALAK